MRRLILLLAATMSLHIVACSTDKEISLPKLPDELPDEGGDLPQEPEVSQIRLVAGGTSFTVTLADNSAAARFAELLPMTLDMSEMNANEKYGYLPVNLPVSSDRSGTIRNGDLMLFGSNCLVLFYKTFSTSYSYTRVGAVDNPSGLADALGTGGVKVTFEQIKN